VRERDKQREAGLTAASSGASHAALPYDSLIESNKPTHVPGDEMQVRGTILAGFREATVDCFGKDGLALVGTLLPAEVHEQTLERLAMNVGWYPESFVLAWYEALWSGPCTSSREKFVRVLDRMLDCGFGRVRRSLLSFASPSMILNRAPTLWRYDHTHGELSVECGAGVGRMRLAHHPYTENPLSCLAIAEVYRYCVSLSRAKAVTGTHYREPSGALVVHLRWPV
jgi:hypothetical protein